MSDAGDCCSEYLTPVEEALECVVLAMERYPDAYTAGSRHAAFGQILDALFAWRDLVAREAAE